MSGPASHNCFVTSSITSFLLSSFSSLLLLLTSTVKSLFSSDIWINGEFRVEFFSSLSIFFRLTAQNNDGRVVVRLGTLGSYFQYTNLLENIFQKDFNSDGLEGVEVISPAGSKSSHSCVDKTGKINANDVLTFDFFFVFFFFKRFIRLPY